MNLLSYFKISQDAPMLSDPAQIKKRYNSLRWSVFLSATIGYGLYYVCRLSLNVVKKPIVDAGILSESELGIMGSALFIAYALGKLLNGFLADRSNVKRFLALGLIISAVVNLILGFTHSFVFFVILWGINGWAQSMGAAPCVLSLSRWFGNRERGTFYGLWSSSHNIGESLTFILTAIIVSHFGWQSGFIGAGLIGMIGVAVILIFMRDTLGSCGLPSVPQMRGEEVSSQSETGGKSIGEYQKEVLRNPAIWILALSSCCMYIARYAVNSWGIFFLEAEKGYSTIEASSIISVSSVCGILGTISCGWLSDKFFDGRRRELALIFGVMNVVGLVLFLLVPGERFWLDVTSMVIFGLSIGALICFLGGLMAVDIASKKASGAALGVIGVASYIGAAAQDMISGFVIEGSKSSNLGVSSYDFSAAIWFWLGAATLSVVFALMNWNVKPKE